MKIAFVGKGGSGKTTTSSLFAQYLAAKNLPVVVYDADINQHMGEALGLTPEESKSIPGLGVEIDTLKHYFAGTNPLVSANPLAMIKTTPPGTGSRLISVNEDNQLYRYFSRTIHGVRLLVAGPFSPEDLGVKCYHSKTGAVEMMLNHTVDGSDSYVITDMTAGADAFASGMFTRFDMTIIVVEPTIKSIRVYQDYVRQARGYDVAIKVVGNKVEDEEDSAFIREQVGDDLIGCLGRSKYVRSRERGGASDINQLEPENIEVLRAIKETLDTCPKNWEKYLHQAWEFHEKNSKSWAGKDLVAQIDRTFTYPV